MAFCALLATRKTMKILGGMKLLLFGEFRTEKHRWLECFDWNSQTARGLPERWRCSSEAATPCGARMKHIIQKYIRLRYGSRDDLRQETGAARSV